MAESSYVIGVDFGTDSVRSLIVDCQNGKEISTSVYYYPRWKEGLYCDPSINQFRQHPLDYIEGLECSIKEALDKAGKDIRKSIKAISVDTTGSTPVVVNELGIPLALLSGMNENPNAMFFLWKDHTAVEEALEINDHACNFKINYLQFVGESILPNGFGQKCFMHFVMMNKCVNKLFHLLNIVIGYHFC